MIIDKSTLEPRTFYTKAKNDFITNHDHVSALEMHKKEYDVHLRDTWNKFKKGELKIIGEFIILLFEKCVSNFGTSIILPVISWLIIWIIFAFWIIGIYRGFNFFDLFVSLRDIYEFVFTNNQTEARDIISYALKPISIFSSNSFLTEGENFKNWRYIMIINFFKTLALAVVSYEVIKAFRKFGRKIQ